MLGMGKTKQPTPTSEVNADEWLEKHISSSAAMALNEDERWTVRRRWRTMRKKPLVFPWPSELTEVESARRWQKRAEQVEAEHQAASGPWLLLLSAGLGALLGLVVGGGGTVAAYVLAGAAIVLSPILSRIYSDAPQWSRRAKEFERRADTLEVRIIRAATQKEALREQEHAALAIRTGALLWSVTNTRSRPPDAP